MNIVPHASLTTFSLPGITHQTIAGQAQGSSLEVWKQTLQPGAATPPHFHECLEIVCILQGGGELIVNGQSETFSAECTLIVPPRQVHQIINTGPTAMHLVASLAESPGRVFLPDGERLPLPWEAQCAL